MDRLNPVLRRCHSLRFSLMHLSIVLLVLIANSVAEASNAITVPFTLRGEHIYMTGTINDKTVTLVLDSGAGGDVITPDGARKLGLKQGRSGVAVGAGGQSTDVYQVTLTSLVIGGARTENQTAYVIPLPDALKCDGLLGAPFFRQWVVTIDYDASEITLTPRGKYSPPVDAVEFHTQIKMETVHVEAVVDGVKGLFKLDTGAAGTLTLFAPFVQKNGMRNKYSPSIEMVTGRGVGGLLYGDVVRLPTFSLGTFEFKGVTATLSRQTKGVFADPELAGNIGEDILRRFKVTFDHSNKRVYLSKGADYDKPFVGNRSGLAIDNVGGVTYARSVIAGSPAANAGIREGDAIMSLADRPDDHFQSWELRDLLNGDIGSTIKLTVRTGKAAPREVSFTLRELY